MGSTAQQKKNARAVKKANGGKLLPRQIFLAVRKALSLEEAIEIYKEMATKEKPE